MRFSYTPFFIRSPESWDDLSRTLLDATEGRAARLRYVASRDAVTDSASMIDVVKKPLTGEADYEIEVHWKNHCRLGDDAIAYRISRAMRLPVIVPDRDHEPNDWLRVTHNGDIYTLIDLDIELYARDLCIAYKKA